MGLEEQKPFIQEHDVKFESKDHFSTMINVNGAIEMGCIHYEVTLRGQIYED